MINDSNNKVPTQKFRSAIVFSIVASFFDLLALMIQQDASCGMWKHYEKTYVTLHED